ncbi:hypothetical protein PHYBOEH_007711 [Phytophthora boehmeriae]|uniref:Uncharacterized protein n=1 Tax=Phytophthora boehmeriae TaxID=109152 RepID=A0A8T1X8R0_9STRA|nr:hypothetical protein PHYBOEH_007711 [Phytophthora boehmeriae]
MVSQASSVDGEVAGRMASRVFEDYWFLDLSCKPQQEPDAWSDGSARTIDEATDLDALEEDCYGPSVSGLPLMCSNCGVSFFSLQIPDDQVDCYCSGECKWSVIMYREMDQRMFAMRSSNARPVTLGTTCSSSSSSFYGDSDDCQENDSLESLSFFSDDDLAVNSSCCN